MNEREKPQHWYIKAICLIFSLSFFIASLAACTYLGIWKDLISGWIRILVNPSPLVTDYYQLGNLASAFFNAGMCGLAWTLLMILLKADCDVNTFAGFMLVVAHCFYGLNFLNMWPPALGIMLFCKFYKISFRDNLAMAMYSTAFGPFISELLFRYHVGNVFMISALHIDILDILYVIAFSIFLGFAIPAMLPGALRLHKGYNLYNGGLAFGLLGLFINAFMFKTFGITAPEPTAQVNAVYEAHQISYMGFIVIFFLLLFGVIGVFHLCILYSGDFQNRFLFKHYQYFSGAGDSDSDTG